MFRFYAWGKLRLLFATTYLLIRLQLLRAVVSIKDSFTLQDRNQDFEVGTIPVVVKSAIGFKACKDDLLFDELNSANLS